MGRGHGNLIDAAIVLWRETNQRSGSPARTVAGIEDQHFDALLLDGMGDAQRQVKGLRVLTAIENVTFARFAYDGFFDHELRHGLLPSGRSTRLERYWTADRTASFSPARASVSYFLQKQNRICAE